MSAWQNKTTVVSAAMFGATVGAAGWIYGASEELAEAGHGAEAALVLWCAAGVWLTGGLLWLLWLCGCKLNLLIAMNVLFGASFVFGVLALWIMRAHGVAAFAIDSAGKYPEWLAYVAPAALLACWALTWYPRIRKRLQNTTF
jgi:hypothetical protein